MTSLTRCRQHRGSTSSQRPFPHSWNTTSKCTSQKPWKACNWAGLEIVQMRTSGYRNQYTAVPERMNTTTHRVTREAEKARPANTTLTAIRIAKITDLRTNELPKPDSRHGMINLTGDNGNQSSRILMVMTLTAPPAAIPDHTDNPGTSQGNGVNRKRQHTTPATSERNKQGK